MWQTANLLVLCAHLIDQPLVINNVVIRQDLDVIALPDKRGEARRHIVLSLYSSVVFQCLQQDIMVLCNMLCLGKGLKSFSG